MDTHSRPRFPLVRLVADHDVRAFTCGDAPEAAEIDEYLRVSALAEQAAGLNRVWVALDSHAAEGSTSIAGYFTLSPLSVPINSAVLGHLGIQPVPYRSVGGYLLGRLGVAAYLQRQGLGAALVAAAVKIARQARDDVAGAFLAVDPKSDSLLAWYEHLDFGFQRLHQDSATKRRLVLRL